MTAKSFSEAVASRGGIGRASATPPGGKPETIEPMIPHQHREDADRTPHAPATDKPQVVEPMIPHKNRREME